ncbi:hypothetical protein [Thalassotalea fusca]
MTWAYKSFVYKPKPRAFLSVNNLLRNDAKFEKTLNSFAELGWEYVEAISLNIGFLSSKEYLIVLKGKKGAAYDTSEEKVLKEEQARVV